MMCPVQSRCGGCPTLHLDRNSELTAKVARVHRIFDRLGLYSEPMPCIAGAEKGYYRNRLRMKVAEGKVDLFNQAKEQGCLVLRPELWDAVTTLKQVTHAEPKFLSGVAHVEIRVSDYEDIGLSFVAEESASSHDWYRGGLRSELGEVWQIADRRAPNQPTLRYDISETLMNDVPIDAFVQVNSEVNRLLVTYVKDAISASDNGTFIDLYCGAGNLTLPLLEAGLSGTAIERNGSGPTVLAQRVNANDVTVLTSDVHDLLGDLVPADVVITNPARSGLKKNYELIASLVLDTMICVGCDAGALGHDVSQLAKYGLEVNEIQTFDMFPGTSHIETVVTLKRRPF